MKKILYVFILVFITLTSCDKNDTINQISKSENKDENFLKFESNNDFSNYLKTFQVSNDTNYIGIAKAKRMKFNVKVPNNFASINQMCQKSESSKMKAINKTSSDDDAIEEMSTDEYNIMVAKNLLQDPILCNVMDTTLRIGIAGNIYKITEDGTFFAPYSKQNELMEKINNFDEIKEHFTMIDNSHIYDLGQDVKFVYSFANSPISDNRASEDENNVINKVKSNATAETPYSEYVSKYGLESEKWGYEWYTLPLWQWLFGKDERADIYFDNNKRMSFELFNVNYVFYTSAGIKVKAQKRKKFLFVSYWVNTSADKLAIGFEKFNGVMTYNAPPSNINPLKDKAYSIFASTFNGMAGNMIFRGYHNIDFIEDWVENIMSFVPEIQVYGNTYPTEEQKQKLYNIPADMLYSELKKLTGQYIFNPIKKQIKPDDPRIAYIEWGSASIPIKSFVRGVQEYSDIESKTIRFNQSGGFYFLNGAVTGYLPSTFAIKDIDVFASVNFNGVWKGVRFYK